MRRNNAQGDPAALPPGFARYPTATPPVAVNSGFATGGDTRNVVKTLAIVLVIAGMLGLVYGSFTYTKNTFDAKLLPIEFSVKDMETVNIPVWVGVGAILIGGVLPLVGNKQGQRKRACTQSIARITAPGKITTLAHPALRNNAVWRS